MTVNSLSLVHSTPFTGLGTQTYNVPATGRYTTEVICTIPWKSPDAPGVVSPTKNVQTITTVADSSGSLNDTYFTFYTAGNIQGYYVWFNINAAGTDPEVEGLTGIEVEGATDVTAADLATATRAAINAVSGIQAVASGATTAVIITNTKYGECTAAADGEDETGFTFAVGTAGTYGTGSGLVVVAALEGTAFMTLDTPTPSQASLSGSAVVQATAADELTVTFSSLADADQLANAVKGVINVYAGG